MDKAGSSLAQSHPCEMETVWSYLSLETAKASWAVSQMPARIRQMYGMGTRGHREGQGAHCTKVRIQNRKQLHSFPFSVSPLELQVFALATHNLGLVRTEELASYKPCLEGPPPSLLSCMDSPVLSLLACADVLTRPCYLVGLVCLAPALLSWPTCQH